ncbi:MAG: hypothetical protein ACFCU1_13245 [Sumerlaeia bacterium]
MSAFYVLFAALAILLIHRTVEHLLCQGPDAKKRKHQLELGTGIFLILSWTTGFLTVLLNNSLRMEYLGLMMIITPFILFGIIFFTFLSLIVYRQEREDDQWNDRS